MKKVLALMLAIVVVLSLAACGGGEKKEDTATEAPTETPISDAELCAEYAVGKIKDALKNPSSMIVNHLTAIDYEDGYIFAVDYTGENGFGGSSRDTTYIQVSKSSNGFAVKSIGSKNYLDDVSQKYTMEEYLKVANTKGYYEFDTQTYRFK